MFGHVLVLAGSPRMLGAAALTTLAAMRSGAGLVTLGIPKSLNLTAQRKISHTVMTLPLSETKEGTISFSAFATIQKSLSKFQAVAIGPGMTTQAGTQRFIWKVIETSTVPLVIDADALNALVGHTDILLKTKTPKILTPHSGEMKRISGFTQKFISENRREAAERFAAKYKCVLLLKGNKTVVAEKERKTYINQTGNAGMATAGSGDVLTGIIAAFLAQGLTPFDAAKYGAYLHGKAGDTAAKKVGKAALMATDMIDLINI